MDAIFYDCKVRFFVPASFYPLYYFEWILKLFLMEENKVLQDLLTNELVSDALGGVDIISFNAEPAAAKGEHYLSTLLRVVVNFRRQGKNSDEQTKIIVKTYPEGILCNFSKESLTLYKELISYHDILPRISEISGKSFTPLRLGSFKKEVLVLEDLKLKGYQMANRIDKLDFEHCKAAIKILAELHAASVLTHEKYPNLFDKINNETLFTDNNFYNRSFHINGFKIMGKEFESIPHLKKYSAKLQNAGERMWNILKEEVKPKDDEINVFIHGDFWTTNILYNYDDENHINDVKLIDFQFCRWGSPAMDLHMFFNTSVRNRGDIQELKTIYVNYFNENILESKKLTIEKLNASLHRLDCFGLMIAVSTMPICTLDSKNALNFDNVTEDDYSNDFPKDKHNPYSVTCKNKTFLQIIPEFLDYYIEVGLL
ncbi:uncharacterized protein LOC142328597 isoform X2 [Lycorma delicatula]|uniref:uncharacterized protein LOC142328597 isoform X2 n=1 Tax=Lycorma delicatula TaxID=130591 RepID=UPI003F51AC12